MAELHDKARATIVHALLDGDALQDECEILSFEDSNGRRYYHAVVLGKDNSSIACICSLPTVTRNVYVTLTDGDIQVVRRVMGMLEEIEMDSPVLLGNVLLLDSPELRARSIVGIILLPVQVSNALSYLPTTVSIDGVEMSLLLVVFLTKEEHDTWKKHGHDALMEFFTKEAKDLVSFGI